MCSAPQGRVVGHTVFRFGVPEPWSVITNLRIRSATMPTASKPSSRHLQWDAQTGKLSHARSTYSAVPRSSKTSRTIFRTERYRRLSTHCGSSPSARNTASANASADVRNPFKTSAASCGERQNPSSVQSRPRSIVASFSEITSLSPPNAGFPSPRIHHPFDRLRKRDAPELPQSGSPRT